MSNNAGDGNVAKSNNEDEGMAAFSPAEIVRIQEIKNRINADDQQAIISYGVRAQRDISDFADSILTEVRANDNGYAAGILNNLVVKVKETGVDSLSGEGFLSRMPVFASLLNPFSRFTERFEKISIQIEKIADELDAARMQMLRDITLLDIMYSKNLEYKKNLDIYIAAAQMKLKELEEATLPSLKAKAELDKRSEDVQQYNDLTAFLNSLDRKITDLRLSRMITLQTGPQIRLIQSGNQALVEKIQSSILNTIPLWKNQVIIAVTLLRQKKALKLQNNVTNTTNNLLEKNAEVLKENTIGIARESQRGIVDIETLKNANNSLIATIEDTLKIQADSTVIRAQAEQELAKMGDQLKSKLVSLKN